MQDKNLRRLQTVELGILNSVAEICERHNLTYYIIGGTLLGAVRHQGFIPWDDDIDIAMPRNDYEKFVHEYRHELPETVKLLHFSTDNDYRYAIAQAVDTQVELREKKDRNTNRRTYAAVDILPLDGLPNHVAGRLFYKLRYVFCRLLLALYYNDAIVPDKDRSVLEKVAIFFITRIPAKRFVNPRAVIRQLDCFLKKYDWQASKFSGTILGAYRFRELVPTSYWGTGTWVRFEEKTFRAPEQTDAYLTHMYGDYMTVPPVHKRISHYEIVGFKD